MPPSLADAGAGVEPESPSRSGWVEFPLSHNIGRMPVSSPSRLSKSDVDGARSAAQCVVETHRRLVDFLAHGQTLAQIDAFVARTLEALSCKSCFLGYRVPKSPPFPSYACLSVNDCVVHGTAGYSTKPMSPGDILKIDIGVTHRGWIGDAAWTYCFGQPAPTVRRLMDCGKESLRRGVATLRPTNIYIDWARAVQAYVEDECHFHLIRGLGGHGYGRKLHMPPFVSNTVPSHPHEWSDGLSRIEAGTLLAVEPMIGLTTGEVFQRGREWPVYTKDHCVSVHYEHDVLITDEGPVVLTEGMDDLPDVVTR